jgi:hypothetical protein
MLSLTIQQLNHPSPNLDNALPNTSYQYIVSNTILPPMKSPPSPPKPASYAHYTRPLAIHLQVAHRPSLILTQSANWGNVPRKLGPRDQLFRSRRWLSKAGLMSHWSSSWGRGPMAPGPGVAGGGWGVLGSCGDPACTWVE